MSPLWRVPPPRRQVMEPNQVHLVAAAMSCDSQQIINAVETRFTGQVVRHVGDGHRRNRIHDDVAIVHPVATTNLHMGTRPDANAASDSPAPDPLTKALGEHHMELGAAQSIVLPRGRQRRRQVARAFGGCVAVRPLVRTKSPDALRAPPAAVAVRRWLPDRRPKRTTRRRESEDLGLQKLRAPRPAMRTRST